MGSNGTQDEFVQSPSWLQFPLFFEQELKVQEDPQIMHHFQVEKLNSSITKGQGLQIQVPQHSGSLAKVEPESVPPLPPIHISAVSRHWDKTLIASLGQFGIEMY